MRRPAHQNPAMLLVMALMPVLAGCNSQQQKSNWDAQILADQTFTELRAHCEQLRKQSRSHENALGSLSDDAAVRYLFCIGNDIDKEIFNCAVKNLSFNAIGSILDLFPSRDVSVLVHLRNFRHRYFSQRYPGNYFGTEDATNYEFDQYARRVIDEFLHHYREYNKDGKIALAHLLHDTLTYPARWDYVPSYMRRELSAYIMNLVPGSGNNASINPPDDWLPESGLPALAIELVSQTGEEQFVPTVMHFIKNLARTPQERNKGFRALIRLKAKGERVERFLEHSLQNDDYRDSAIYIIDAMAQTGSHRLDEQLLPYIGGKNHRLWATAAHTFWRLPDFEQRIAALPRRKQVQIFLMAEHATATTLSNKSLMNRIQPQDAQVLINTLDLNSYRDFLCVARQSMYLLKERGNENTVSSVIHMLDELTSTQEGLRLWLIFGYGVKYLERVSGQQFWNPEYPHGVTDQSEMHRHTLLELEETVQKIHVWWDANKNTFPSQLMIGQDEG